VFIRCTTCRWSRELRQSTRELEKLRQVETRLLQQAKIQQERLGTVNGMTRRLLANTRAAMQKEQEVVDR
jgi:ferredoxin